MNAELERVSKFLEEAVFPEDVFGDLSGSVQEKLNEAKKIFRQNARVLHPDKYAKEEDRICAEAAFKLLNPFYKAAQDLINNGIYGERKAPKATYEPMIIKTRRYEYVVDELLYEGDISNIYHAIYEDGGVEHVLVKVARDPKDNDLVTNEARILRHLAAAGSDFNSLKPYASQLVETFGYREDRSSQTRQAVVLKSIDGLYSFEQVKKRYPDGIDPKDMAWMFGRLMFALELAHANGVVHGAVVPSHVLIHPEEHGLVLIDWSYAVLNPAESDEKIKAIPGPYGDWYPEEVLKKEEPMFGLDLYMAAQCMVYLLGGDPVKKQFPDSVPMKIRAFLKGCMISAPTLRPQDAIMLRQEFIKLIEGLWGRREFHYFTMAS